MKRHLVITSISAPNEVLMSFADLCAKEGVSYIVIGDLKSPADFALPGCAFYSVEDQKKLRYRIVKDLPFRHYARKNLGYLIAAEDGADLILETDDDNFARKEFFEQLPVATDCADFRDKGWLNIFDHFSDENIWPRGFPLEGILSRRQASPEQRRVEIPIQQGLIDENPDVDAVFRLTRNLPLNFAPGKYFSLSENTWCPFNSQNTIWYRKAFPLLYLPSHCSFRMTDIWRSLVSQRIAWANGWSILFRSPTVWQERNEHNLLRDFQDEVAGYLNNAKIGAALQGMTMGTGIADNLVACYRMLIDMGLVEQEELNLVECWLHDISAFAEV
jgi:hypothetical protein